MIRRITSRKHTVGADQFVYFDAVAPRRALAPDVFVKLGLPDHDFDAFFVWEKGAPEVAFEVLSPKDSTERWTFKEKLRRYHALGVRELVCVNVDAKPGRRLRAWDRIEHDLVERVVEGERTPCLTLGVRLLVGPVDGIAIGLRVARDGELVLTDEEASEAAIAERDAARRGERARSARTAARRARHAERTEEEEAMMDRRRPG